MEEDLENSCPRQFISRKEEIFFRRILNEKKNKPPESSFHPGQHWQDYAEIAKLIARNRKYYSPSKAGGILINICMLGLTEIIKPVLM